MSENIDFAEKVFGSDIGSLKSKTMRKRPIPMLSSIIDIPTKLLRVNKEVEILLDGLQVNGLQFISSIFYDSFYRIA